MYLSGKVTITAGINIDNKDRTKCGASVNNECCHLVDEGVSRKDMYCDLFGELPIKSRKIKGESFLFYSAYRCQKCIDAFGTGGKQ